MQHFDKEAREALIAYTIEIGHETLAGPMTTSHQRRFCQGFSYLVEYIETKLLILDTGEQSTHHFFQSCFA